jgi:hypothetical protein
MGQAVKDQQTGLNQASHSLMNTTDIAGMVAAITESDPGARVKQHPKTPLVNRDSATRRARRLAVEFDVGDLSIDP